MEVTFYDKHGRKKGMDFSGIFSLHTGLHKVREVRKKFDLPFVTANAVQLSVQDIDTTTKNASILCGITWSTMRPVLLH
jgi:hypothetical protein